MNLAIVDYTLAKPAWHGKGMVTLLLGLPKLYRRNHY
jgi:hypothetical protein